MIPQFLNNLWSAFQLQDCCLCGQQSHSPICQYCYRSLSALTPPHSDLLMWPEVKKRLEPPVYDRLICLCEYQWPVDWLLKQLKYHRRLWPAHVLSELFCRHYANRLAPLPQCLIPIPLHSRRFLSRHYNQACLISRQLSNRLHIPFDTRLISRSRATESQAHLTAAQRRRNMAGAFSANPALSYEHIALVDDVITTGATCNAAALSLRAVNPQLRIDVWTMAISLLHQ